jgi:BolA protein
MTLTIDLIRERLEKLQPLTIDIQDDSAKHVGHAGAKDGGHYELNIISNAFIGTSRIKRHQMIYALLSDLMQTKIHALAIHALTPEEAQTN